MDKTVTVTTETKTVITIDSDELEVLIRKALAKDGVNANADISFEVSSSGYFRGVVIVSKETEVE